MKKLQDLKISGNSAYSLCTTNPQNQRQVEKTLYYYQIKRLVFLLTEFELVPNVQNSSKLNLTSFLLER